MPAPQSAMMKQFARLKFSSFNLKVPDGWQPPQGDPAAAHYSEAFSASEKQTTPDMTMPPLFTAASMNKYHTDTQKMLSSTIGGFIDEMCDAICSAWSQWQQAATMVGFVVAGPTCSVGQVMGMPWTPLILAQAPKKKTPMMMKYASAIANTIGTGWLTYTATIKSPGLPMYPAFAALPPGPAPPTPSIPFPLIAFTQVAVSLDPAMLKNQMVGMFGDPTAQYSGQLFEAICDGFDKCFKMWQTTTQVMNVLPIGAAVGFPVGPVAGTATMTPGGFI